MKKALLQIEKQLSFNFNQQQYFEKIISAFDFVKKETCLYFFIQSLASIKKTFLYNILCYHYCAYEKIVLYITFSNIASLLLLEGRTSHSYFWIPFKFHKNSQLIINKNLKLENFLH